MWKKQNNQQVSGNHRNGEDMKSHHPISYCHSMQVLVLIVFIERPHSDRSYTLCSQPWQTELNYLQYFHSLLQLSAKFEGVVFPAAAYYAWTQLQQHNT